MPVFYSGYSRIPVPASAETSATASEAPTSVEEGTLVRDPDNRRLLELLLVKIEEMADDQRR